MKLIRDIQTLVGVLESGDLNKETSTQLEETLEKLLEMSNDVQGKTYKGSLTLKLDLSVRDGVVEINADVSSKVPKRPRRSTVYWVVDGGKLSTEHPQQHDMFGGPREIDRSRG